MNTFNIFLLIPMAALLTGAGTPVKNNYSLSKEYTVTINGTSNLHSWNEKVETVTGDALVNWNHDGSFDLEKISIKMAVRSIKSDMGAVMNNNTYKALKADENPEIIYSLKVPVVSIQTGKAGKTLVVKGNLSVAGATRFIEMKVKISMPNPGKMTFEGSHTLKMTDYGIDPPTALFGTLKTGDQIIIRFKTNLTITPH